MIITYLIKLLIYKKNLMLYNNIKLSNKCIFYMTTCCTSFENLGNISDKYINYKDEHYIEGISTILKNKEQDEIDEISRKNLELINRLSEV